MPFWFFPAVLAMAIVVTLVSGIWLMVHLRALASLFAGHGDIVPAPSARRASKRKVWFALAAFTSGLLLTLTILVLQTSGVINEWVVMAD